MEPLFALLLTFLLMWVLLIRPQQRRMRQHQSVVSSLRAGDEIVTAGGIYGTVLSVGDDDLRLEVAPGVELRVLRAAVSQKVTSGGAGSDDGDEDDDEEENGDDEDYEEPDWGDGEDGSEGGADDDGPAVGESPTK